MCVYLIKDSPFPIPDLDGVEIVMYVNLLRKRFDFQREIAWSSNT